jgi:NDP-sugar pyrophosphorylase family protein
MTKNNNFIEEEYGKLFTACVIIDEHGKQNESWLLISNLKNYGIDKSLYFAKYKFEQFISQKLQEQREELKKEIVEMIKIKLYRFSKQWFEMSEPIDYEDIKKHLKDLISKIKNI